VRETIDEQGGTAFILTVPTRPPEVHESIGQQFQADRAREYGDAGSTGLVSASRSWSANTATLARLAARQAAAILTAISPRLAISTLCM
jgi:hypothetical protein